VKNVARVKRLAAEHSLDGWPAQREQEGVVYVMAALEHVDATRDQGGLSPPLTLGRDALAWRQPPDGRPEV
jgi:hypothetical protein